MAEDEGNEEKEEKTMGELSEEGKNVISKEEFEGIEEEEGGPQPEEVEGEEEGAEEPPEEASRLDKLTMRIDKIEAQLQTMKDERETYNERFQNLSEQIGELRSSLVSKDEDLDELEQDFGDIRKMFEEIEPGEFERKLEKKEEEITQNQAQMEELQEKIKDLRSSFEEVDEKLGGIKNIENLVDLSNKIEEKMDEIEENKNYTDRRASKVENLFSELSDRLNEFENYKGQADKNKETITELMKTVDKLDAKMENTASEDDLDDLEENLKSEIDEVRTDLQKKIYDASDMMEELLEKIEKKDLNEMVSGYGDMKETVNRLSQQNKKLKKRQKMLLEVLNKISDRL